MYHPKTSAPRAATTSRVLTSKECLDIIKEKEMKKKAEEEKKQRRKRKRKGKQKKRSTGKCSRKLKKYQKEQKRLKKKSTLCTRVHPQH